MSFAAMETDMRIKWALRPILAKLTQIAAAIKLINERLDKLEERDG